MATGSGGRLASGLGGLQQKGLTPINICRKVSAIFSSRIMTGAIKNYEQAIALGVKSANAFNMLGMAYRFKYQQTKDPKLQENEIISFQKALDVDAK